MTKADLVDEIAQRTGLTKKDVADTVDEFLEAVSRGLKKDGVKASILVKGTRAATTIVETAEEGDFGLIALTSNGRGGFKRVMMGADSERVVANTDRCVLMMPSRNNH